jgi:hypothetical protein
MADTSFATVTARLDRLERESRRWRRLALASWLGLAAVALLGQAAPTAAPAPGTVEAQRFVLRDARGRVGATLAWERDGGPRLALADALGRDRAVVSVSADGWPGLTLLDRDGQTARATLVVGPDGAPGLALFDAAGRPRLAAALFHGRARGGAAGAREPTPAVAAYDASGALRVTFGIRGADVAGLELADGRGAARGVLEVLADGTPGLALRDATGRNRATLTVLDDGAPALNLNGPDGRARAAMTLLAGRGAALALADREGKVVWSAP